MKKGNSPLSIREKGVQTMLYYHHKAEMILFQSENISAGQKGVEAPESEKS